MDKLLVLPEDVVSSLLAKARKASESAYAPYSNIRVGAALFLDDGSFVVGSNVENSSYGLTICAERSAVFAAVTQRRYQIRAIAISSPDIPAISPCGACRQVLAEFSDAEMVVLLDFGKGTEPMRYTMGELLPASFSLK